MGVRRKEVVELGRRGCAWLLLMPEDDLPLRITGRDPLVVDLVNAGLRPLETLDLPTLGLPCDRRAPLMAAERPREVLAPRETDRRGLEEREDDFPTDRDALGRDTREADERFGLLSACAYSAGSVSAQAKSVPQNQMLRLTDRLITHPLADQAIMRRENATH